MAAEMIERVARASFACWRKSMDELGLHLDKGQEFEDMIDLDLAFAYENARAMIAAMREPTNKMLEGLGINLECKETYVEYKFYQKMIDAALKE